MTISEALFNDTDIDYYILVLLVKVANTFYEPLTHTYIRMYVHVHLPQ